MFDPRLTVKSKSTLYNVETCEKVIKRNEFVQTLVGELISYDKFISSIAPEVEAE